MIALLLCYCLAASFAVARLSAATRPIIDAARFDSLQSAIDAVPSEGGIVRLPPGVWEIREPLKIGTENFTFEGSGPSTHIVNLDENGRPAIQIRAPAPDGTQPPRIWRIELRHFRVSGNPKSGDGILAERINEIYLSSVGIDHNGGNGISLIDCYEDPRASDNIISYNGGAGLLVDRCHDIVVSANHFEENRDAVLCKDSHNLTATGNNVDDHVRHGFVIEYTHASVISGNMIENSQGIAVVIDRDSFGISISGNAIAQNEGGGIHLLDAWGCTVSGNALARMRTGAMWIGPSSGRITVTGNNFTNSYLGGGRDRGNFPARGIHLDGAEDILVSGNTFSGLEGAAVTARSASRRIMVVANLMTDLNRETNGRGPALLLDQVEGAVIENNMLPRKNETERHN
jgi:parallel beta-helix repeat protein